MCNQCNADPRDDMLFGTRALRGLSDLLSDIDMGGKGFERTRPGELGELVDLICERLDRASTKLQGYLPAE